MCCLNGETFYSSQLWQNRRLSLGWNTHHHLDNVLHFLPTTGARLTPRSIECNVGIITACLPCLKPLFKRMLEKSSWGYGSSKGRSRKGTNDHKLQTLPNGSKYQHNGTASRITASKNHFGTLSSGKDHDLGGDNISEESILPLQSNTITKTTVVTVDREIGVRRPDIERGEGGIWGKGIVKQDFAPERRIEDRI